MLVRIAILWSTPYSASTLLKGMPALPQALLYGDEVTVWTTESDSLLEAYDYSSVRDKFTIDDASLTQYNFSLNEEYLLNRKLPLLEQCRDQAILEAAVAGSDKNCFRYLELAAQLETILGDGLSSDRIGEVLREHDQQPGRTANVFLTWRRQLRDADPRYGPIARQRRLSKYLLITDYFNEALSENAYGLTDGARGVWSSPVVRDLVLRNVERDRAAHASLAVGQIRRLPRIEALDWSTVADVRRTLQRPLVRFRAAMEDMAKSATVHPLDPDFDGYVEAIWTGSVAPALAELDELSRQATLREVLSNDVLGDVKTYGSPLFALAAGHIAELDSLAKAVAGLAPPLAKVWTSRRQRRRELAAKDFYFLHAVQRSLRSR